MVNRYGIFVSQMTTYLPRFTSRIFVSYLRYFNRNSKVDGSSVPGTACSLDNLSQSRFLCVYVVQSLVFYVVFRQPLFVLFLWWLYLISFDMFTASDFFFLYRTVKIVFVVLAPIIIVVSFWKGQKRVFVILGLMVSFVSNCNGSFCYFRFDGQFCI